MPAGYAFDQRRLSAMVDSLAGGKVLLVGDIMLDEYLEGDAERISPEAPIPVVKVAQTRLLLGGAGNVARNIARLGGTAHLISISGADTKGDTLRELLHQDGVSATILPLASRPTTLKTRVIARHQQMLRIDQEDASPLTPEQTSGVLDAIRAHLDEFAILVVSDYGKGVISPALMQGLMALCDAAATKPRILVDPKPSNFPCYKGTYIMTPNAKETSEAAKLPVRVREEILAAGKAILDDLQCEHLLTTLGAQGMALFVTPDEVWHIPTAAQSVFDVTGAGDTVIATLALCLAAGTSLLDACVLANYAAGKVVADVGAGTVSPDELKNILAHTTTPCISRWA